VGERVVERDADHDQDEQQQDGSVERFGEEEVHDTRSTRSSSIGSRSTSRAC
jgi:hypothetical protein